MNQATSIPASIDPKKLQLSQPWVPHPNVRPVSIPEATARAAGEREKKRKRSADTMIAQYEAKDNRWKETKKQFPSQGFRNCPNLVGMSCEKILSLNLPEYCIPGRHIRTRDRNELYEKCCRIVKRLNGQDANFDALYRHLHKSGEPLTKQIMALLSESPDLEQINAVSPAAVGFWNVVSDFLTDEAQKFGVKGFDLTNMSWSLVDASPFQHWSIGKTGEEIDKVDKKQLLPTLPDTYGAAIKRCSYLSSNIIAKVLETYWRLDQRFPEWQAAIKVAEKPAPVQEQPLSRRVFQHLDAVEGMHGEMQ